MKKLIIMSGLAVLLMASCKKKEEPVPPPAPPPVEDPAPPPTPEPQTHTTTTTNVTVEKTVEEPDGTTVNVSSDGVSVQNKNGDAKNNVTISKKKAEVEIKTP